jgi:hypothetical protein
MCNITPSFRNAVLITLRLNYLYTFPSALCQNAPGYTNFKARATGGRHSPRHGPSIGAHDWGKAGDAEPQSLSTVSHIAKVALEDSTFLPACHKSQFSSHGHRTIVEGGTIFTCILNCDRNRSYSATPRARSFSRKLPVLFRNQLLRTIFSISLLQGMFRSAARIAISSRCAADDSEPNGWAQAI